MSYNSSFTGQQADAALQKAAVIQTDNNGTKFLADDGTYKEAGDKTNVLILSLENDLANGEKDSPVTPEVSASLLDAITTGKACVNKSANSDILANLQKIGNNVTIILEQISRVGQTFVAVNTSITVNTSTNVIADYQTGAIVLETEGDGSKFLANDGTYKNTTSVGVIDITGINDEYTQLNDEQFADIMDAINKDIVIVKRGSAYSVPYQVDNSIGLGNDMIDIRFITIHIGDDIQGLTWSPYIIDAYQIHLDVNDKLLRIELLTSFTNAVPTMKVLTESEYAALGTTPETDGVLYFVTPD